MVLAQIARLADTMRVEFAIGMLTLGGQFVAPFRMVTVLAHATGVVNCVNVGTLRDFLSRARPFRFIVIG